MLKEEVRDLIPMAIRWVYNVDFPAAGVALYKFIKERIEKFRIHLPISDHQLFSICKDVTDKKSIGFIKLKLEEMVQLLDNDSKNQIELLLNFLLDDLNELLTKAIEYINENPDHIVFIMKDWRGENWILIEQFHVDVGKGIGNLYFGTEKGEFFRSIRKEFYGDDYPDELDPDGYVTITDLQNFVKYLNVGPAETIIDLGCGKGGPGMWIAREMGVNYVGIDKCNIAIEKANLRIKDFGTKDKISFIVGDFSSTDLLDNQYDGAVSIDALQMIGDPVALQEALYEINRILRIGAPFLFSCGEVNFPNRVDDYHPLLKDAGFNVEIYDEIPNWERPRRLVLQKILESRDELIKDMGKFDASFLFNEAQTDLPILDRLRRVFVVARKI